MAPAIRAAIYARVSTLDQEPENQLQELRRYVQARGWTWTEYIDHGVSGCTDRRPALDQLVADARRRKVDTVVVWRLDRLGRSLKHLVTLLDDLQALGVGFVSLGEGIDLQTPAGRLQLHILAALAEFERARIVERVQAGLQRAKRQGRTLGRPRVSISRFQLARVQGLSRDFHFAHRIRAFIHQHASPHARSLQRTLFCSQLPSVWGRARRETDWSRCF